MMLAQLGFMLVLVASASAQALPNLNAKLNPPSRANSPGTNMRLEVLRPRTPGLVLDVENRATLPPGHYQTQPYACRILVPAPQADDVCLQGQKQPAPPMPAIRPDLKTIPLGPAQP